jgi:hemolysin activation/secretion protein
VLITRRQAFPFRLTLSANDGGSEATGKHQGSATLSGDHLLSLNDLFYVTWNHGLREGSGRGTRGNTLHYSLPLGYWMLGATRSAHHYHQSIAGAFQDYVYSGESCTDEVKLSRLIHRDATNKSTMFLRAYLTRSKNFIDGTEIEVQRRRMAGWEAGAGHRAFFGGAALDLDLAYRRGAGAFSALRAPEDVFGEGTARPRIISAGISLLLPFQVLGQNLRYHGLWRAQWNRSPLVPQDRFSVGGRYTVRGFDGESVLMAERGYLLRNDLSLSFLPGHEAYAGLDHGRVGGRSAKWLVGRELTGAVLGLRGVWRQLSYDIFAARPVNFPKYFRTRSHTAGFTLALSY